jgi:hypothetical protein
MTNNPDHFYRGAHVKMSEEGARQFPRRTDRVGRVISPYPRDQIVGVRWNGLKTPERLHIDFLERLTEQLGPDKET